VCQESTVAAHLMKSLWAGYQLLGHRCVPHVFCPGSQMPAQQGCDPASASLACAGRFAGCEGVLGWFRSLSLPGWHARWARGCGGTSSGCPLESPGRTCKARMMSTTLSLGISCSVSPLLSSWLLFDVPLRGKLFSPGCGFLGIMLEVWVQMLAFISVPMCDWRGAQELQVIKSAVVHFSALSFRPSRLAKEVCEYRTQTLPLRSNSQQWDFIHLNQVGPRWGLRLCFPRQTRCLVFCCTSVAASGSRAAEIVFRLPKYSEVSFILGSGAAEYHTWQTGLVN